MFSFMLNTVCHFEYRLLSKVDRVICSKYCLYSSIQRIPIKNNSTPSSLLHIKPTVQLHTTAANKLFWEKDRKGGYDTKTKEKVTTFQNIRSGLNVLKEEIGIWKQEVQDKIYADPLYYARHGETDLLWCFDNQAMLDKWVTTSDSDHNQGYSKCSLQLSKAGRGLFSGNLETRVPLDGRIKRAGYCGMRSTRVRKSFKRDSYYNWTIYNTLVLKVRGDGRPYVLNISTEGYFDITWNDIYHYVLYTRGGPYWQVAKIPFSKFLMGSKGRVQDKQVSLPLERVSHFGISCGEKVEGQFGLEIEYIGVEFDPNHNEEFAYETYITPKFMVGV